MTTKTITKFIPVSQLAPNMLMDWEGDIYADPHHDEMLYECEYQRVYSVKELPDGWYEVISEADNRCIFPPEHNIKIVTETERKTRGSLDIA